MINTNKIAFATALSISIIYSIFTLIDVIWPNQLLKLMGTAHHLKSVEPFQMEVTINNYIAGLIFHFVVVYAFVWLAGFIYVAISRKK